MRKLLSFLKIRKSSMAPADMWGRVFDLSKKQCVTLEGFKLYVMPNDYIGAGIMSSGTYEPHVSQLLRRHLKEGDVFLDLGANVGYFSMLASSLVGLEGKVISFEPNPQNLQLIYQSQIENDFTNQVVYPYAASDESKILRFTTVGSNGGVVTDHATEQRYFLLVQAVTVDNILSNQRVSLVKLDVEAHEPYVIRGMQNLLRVQRPLLITEFHPWAMQINNKEAPEAYLVQLEDLGYRLSVIFPSEVKWMSRHDIMLYWKSLSEETAHLDLFCEPI